MSELEALELGTLLGIDKISHDGYELDTGYSYHDFWKEYIYRARGLPPKVFG